LSTSWGVNSEIPEPSLIQKVSEANLRAWLVGAHLWTFDDGTKAVYLTASTFKPKELNGYELETFIENVDSDVDLVLNTSDIRSIFN